MSSILPILSVLLLALGARGAENGMDMSMDDGMTLATGSMLPMLHFTLGDTLWFDGWVPQTRGALFGACVGLFVLALVDRWVAAMRALMEAHWREAGQRAGRVAEKECENHDENKKSRRRLGMRLRAPSFVPAHDVMRGAMHAVQATLGFAFMLAVMTFQASYIITLIGGLGVGEMLFGRYTGAAVGRH
ncbi:CTR copper uptake transporter [Mycena maculata]|uniref:Copper transport protein n=1 Tax=Mycena maculata TaxID=230809 RepID=A0AAD7KC71_9AGAR|nr:CTR copper uptake transporter [Mycena maculata]